MSNTAGTGQWSQGDPFNNLHSSGYWSATTKESDTSYSWVVGMNDGVVGYGSKSVTAHIWPVRGGRECIEDETRPCGTDMGECEYGVETCTDGLWRGCVGGIPPTDEVCEDGLDNDCDGEIDEGCEMLIDTGQPTDSTYNWSLHNNPTSTVWLAGEFTLDQDYILNSIQFFVSHHVSGTVTMVIYEDSGEVPDVSNELFSNTFYGQSGYDANWDGLTGLNWYLPHGTYWVAIEPRLPDEYYYGGAPSDAPFPLNNYAAYNGSNGFYVESDLLTFGLRIAGRLPTP